MDRWQSMCLVLHNMSAAFDTPDHATLLKCLQNRFKITGLVLKWIESYLSDRSQAVVLKNEEGETATSKVVRLKGGTTRKCTRIPSVHLVHHTSGRYMQTIWPRFSFVCWWHPAVCIVHCFIWRVQQLLHENNQFMCCWNQYMDVYKSA